MSDDASPERFTFLKQLHQQSWLIGGGIAVLAIGSIALLYTGFSSANAGQDASLRFIGLLIVFMTALAATATVFFGLRMGDGEEAFGMPSGSIRALLATGIMILFVVFGLPLITAQGPEAVPSKIKHVKTTTLDETVRTYLSRGYEVSVENSLGNSSAGSDLTDIELTPPDHYAERLDVNRQLITAIITLLTSVVGFYFGSRSVTDAIKPSAGPDPSSTDLAVQRKEIGTRLDALKKALLDQEQKVQAADTVPDPANPDEMAERKRVRGSIDTLRANIQAQQTELEKTLAQLDTAIASVASAQAPDVQAVQQAATREGLGKAKDLIAAAESALPAYNAEVANYVAASAQG